MLQGRGSDQLTTGLGFKRTIDQGSMTDVILDKQYIVFRLSSHAATLNLCGEYIRDQAFNARGSGSRPTSSNRVLPLTIRNWKNPSVLPRNYWRDTHKTGLYPYPPMKSSG